MCTRLGLELLVAFGSAVRDKPSPQAQDLDLAFAGVRGTSVDVLQLVGALVGVTGFVRIDLLDLSRADPVARAEALLNGVPLFEAGRDSFAQRQMAAFSERLDTAWLRRLELEVLAR